MGTCCALVIFLLHVGIFESVCPATFALCPRSRQFEAQQAALHQQLLVLQVELAAAKQLYDSLLEQVSQQNGLIRQFRELPDEAPKSEGEVVVREPETTGTLGGCRFGRGPASSLT